MDAAIRAKRATSSYQALLCAMLVKRQRRMGNVTPRKLPTGIGTRGGDIRLQYSSTAFRLWMSLAMLGYAPGSCEVKANFSLARYPCWQHRCIVPASSNEAVFCKLSRSSRVDPDKMGARSMKAIKDCCNFRMWSIVQTGQGILYCK